MNETKIGWCDSTVNGSSGCDGCELWNGGEDHVNTCYAGHLHENRLAKALPDLYAPNFSTVKMIPGRFKKAAGWSDLSFTNRPEKPWLDGLRRHIFVGDMGDFLSRNVTDAFIENELMAAITSAQGQRHIWQLLTKRPRRLAELSIKWGGLPDNVIAMTTVTNQRTANIRIPDLLNVKCRTRGLSIEPLLGAIDLDPPMCEECGLVDVIPSSDGSTSYCSQCDHNVVYGNWIGLNGVDWVIIGGESGKPARMFRIDDAERIIETCKDYGVRIFVKQLGTHPFRYNTEGEMHERLSLPDAKGENWSAWPEHLRIRQMPAMEATP